MRTTLLLALLLVVSGCSGIRFRSPIVRADGERRAGPGKLTPSEIQSEVMTFTDTFNAAVSEAWNRAAATGRAESPAAGLAAPTADTDKASQIRRASLQSKI